MRLFYSIEFSRQLFGSHSATETHGTARISPTFTQTDIGTAFRRILCPICVARIMAFNTLSVMSLPMRKILLHKTWGKDSIFPLFK